MCRRPYPCWSFACFLAVALFGHSRAIADGSAKPIGARVVKFYGYDDCIRLENASTRVTLCPAAGGRVLSYQWNGVEALYLPPGNEGARYEPGKRIGMDAGRFDIGPENTIPRHPMLWAGPWKGELRGDRSARLTSVKDKPTGVQLIRDFQLDATSSRLKCTQTIHNVSDHTVEYCHWSRTFAHGGGIVVLPTSEPSRFPHKYVMYTPAPNINFRPEDPNIRVLKEHIEIHGPPAFPKLGFDSMAGWFAYLMKNDLMFIKTFPTYPDRVYNEVAGLTVSIWYPDRPMCELEPIGPRERLAPGKSASFTETWLLAKHAFPKDGKVDFAKIKQIAAPRN